MLIMAISAVLFTCSGSGGGIYATIEREVKLNNRSVVNIVNRMCQFGSNLYSCNGSLNTKGAGAGAGWTQVPVEGVQGRIISVAADNSYLYVLAVTSESETSDSYIGTCTVYYSANGSTFTSTGLSGTSTSSSGCWLFDNKAKDSANRQAFFNNGSGGTFQLAGATFSSISGNVKGAAFWGGATHFHSSEAITANTDETAGWTSDNLSVLDDKNNELWKDNIKALTYFASGSNTYLFAGFDSNHYNGGYTPYNLATGHPDTSLTNPSQGGFSGSEIKFLRNINGVIYMSVYMQPSSRTGLWAYYPGSAGWNIE